MKGLVALVMDKVQSEQKSQLLFLVAGKPRFGYWFVFRNSVSTKTPWTIPLKCKIKDAIHYDDKQKLERAFQGDCH